MRRVTLDANVLAPGLTSRGSAAAQIIQRWQAGEFILVVSDHIVAELRRTLADPYFAARLSSAAAADLVAVIEADAIVTPLTVVVQGVATHPEDDAVLATALSGQAAILCTRDKQLLRLGRYQGVAILSPGELLHLLEEEAGEQP